jgi:uncharacterized Zn finger protein
MPALIDRAIVIIAAKAAGASLLPDNAQWTNRMEIKSETSSRLYIVAQHKTNGVFACSCPGYKRHRNCKHLKAMTPQLLASGVSHKVAR